MCVIRSIAKGGGDTVSVQLGLEKKKKHKYPLLNHPEPPPVPILKPLQTPGSEKPSFVTFGEIGIYY